MRRKSGVILPIELAILEASVELLLAGTGEFHGFMIAKEMKERDEARRLTAHGTLYRAMERMEKAGLLASRWEAPEIAAQAERPRRRLYSVTAAGQQGLAKNRPEVSPVVKLQGKAVTP